jgi:hypothetical protein
MGKLNNKLAGIAIASMLSTGSAWAVSFSDGGAAAQQILDNITLSTATCTPPAGTTLAKDSPCTSSVNASTDALVNDSYWSITGSGGGSSTMMLQLTNVSSGDGFGIYDKNDINNNVTLFDSNAAEGSQKHLSIDLAGNVFVNFNPTGVTLSNDSFGFFLTVGNSTWYSDDIFNTADGADHMAAYQGNNYDEVQIGSWAAGTWEDNEYALLWESAEMTEGNGDYGDFAVMIESFEVVPAPATLALMGLGLLGMAYRARRKSA